MELELKTYQKQQSDLQRKLRDQQAAYNQQRMTDDAAVRSKIRQME